MLAANEGDELGSAVTAASPSSAGAQEEECLYCTERPPSAGSFTFDAFAVACLLVVAS